MARAGPAPVAALAVLFCDLDRFKEVNDAHGHAGGRPGAGRDRRPVVRHHPRRRHWWRGSAATSSSSSATASTDPDALAALAERVIEAVHRPIAVDDGEVRVGISIGVAMANQPADGGVSGDRILTMADQAMYRAKATGGNRYRVVEAVAGLSAGASAG